MKILRLELRNFEGYRDASVRFTDGLNVIVGRNSVGKTTLLDAILYALYGSVPGVEKRLLASRRGAGGLTRVVLEFEASGARVEVVREGRLMGDSFRTERVLLTVNGKPVGVNGETELNKKIAELVKMGPKSFCTLIYARQGELTRILEPSRDEMDMALGISIMREIAEELDEARKELEKYDGRDAKTLLSMVQERIRQLEAEKSECGKNLRIAKEDVKRLEESLGKAASEEMRKLLDAVKRRDEVQRSLETKRSVLAEILRGVGCSSLADLRSLADGAKKRHADACLKMRELEEERGRLREKAEGLRRRIDVVRSLLASVQAPSPSGLKEKLARIRAEAAAAEGECKALRAEAEAVYERLSVVKGRLEAVEGEVEEHKRLLEEGYARCPTCGQEISAEKLAELVRVKEAEAAELSSLAEALRTEHDGVKGRLREAEVRLEEVKAELRRLEDVERRVEEALNGLSLEALEGEAASLLEEVSRVDGALEGLRRHAAEVEAEEKTLQKTLFEAERLAREVEADGAEADRLNGVIGCLLSSLNMPFDPCDPDLKVKVAGLLPISPEAADEKRRELEEKRRLSGELEARLARLEAEYGERKILLEELLRRLEAAGKCGRLADAIRAGIEGYRKRKLRAIADEALRVYSSITDQKVYDAFRIREDDYAVEVHQPGLSDYIPAKRVGGGHQTIIALALRIAVLRAMNHRSLLILDEPTYGVDSENLPQLINFISEAAKKVGQTILVTHYELGLEEAANVIRVAVGSDGYSTVKQE